MYCKYCGRQIADDSKFCEFCGNLVQHREMPEKDLGEPIRLDVEEQAPEPESVPEETVVFRPQPKEEAPEERPPVPTPAKKKKKLGCGAIAGIVSGSVALIGLIVLIVVLSLRPTVRDVDVTQFINFKVSGYNGYGTATCEIDWSGLETAALGDYPVGTDSKSKKKQADYREQIAILKSAVKLEFEKKENLSVGDTLQAKVTVDEKATEPLHINFSKARTKDYTIKEKDLNGSSAFDPITEFLDVKFDGLSGSATAAVVAKERKEAYTLTTYDGKKYELKVRVSGENELRFLFAGEDGTEKEVKVGYLLDKTEKIGNKDTVTLTLDTSSKKDLMDFGLSLSNNQKTFTADGLNALVDKISDIEKTKISTWNTKISAMVHKTVLSNWATFIHGGNTAPVGNATMENVVLAEKVLVCGETDNRLYLVYSAQIGDDMILLDSLGTPQTMYFAAVVENIIADSDGKLIEKDIKLPDGKKEDVFGAFSSIEEFEKEMLDGKYISEDRE